MLGRTSVTGPLCAICRRTAKPSSSSIPSSARSLRIRSIHQPKRVDTKFQNPKSLIPNSRNLGTTTTESSSSKPLKIAIIGSGPSGFYTASRILSSIPIDSPNGRNVEVHMYDRLPTPYGLVRYGVAADHAEVRNCAHKFDELSQDPRFQFFGNVALGTPPSADPNPSTKTPLTALSTYTYPHALHIPLSSLLPYYSTLILSYGASLSNPLTSVTGSSSSKNPLGNVFPALAFVSWYNGHPAFQDLTINLQKVQDVTIVGQGNVALDVARILLKGRVGALGDTDMPDEVLEVLANSRVERVTAVGRRGPGQVAFTTKEFREMINLPGVKFGGVDPDLLKEAQDAIGIDQPRKRLLGLMEKPNTNGTSGDEEGSRQFNLDFLKSPKSFLGDPNTHNVLGVAWDINQLLTSPPVSNPDPPNSQKSAVSLMAPLMARPTGETVTTRTDMVIESVGYRSEPLLGSGWDLPFETSRGRVRNVGGRVVDESGIAIPGVYAVGWAARGPVGVIASTMHDAYSLAGLIMDDHYTSGPDSANISSPLAVSPEKGLPDPIPQGLKDGRVVDLKRWERIDKAERERGRTKGKEREKFRKIEDMLAV